MRASAPTEYVNLLCRSPVTLLAPKGFKADGAASVAAVGVLVPSREVWLEPDRLALVTNDQPMREGTIFDVC
ncbi:hypothetical protein Pla52o_18180 [Novipirellula galeiformis]|uniref:Uncharacterized protein n=1 Tax=Novipirellula galeiformis TaxID=2528004 RepID=A0A5C6CIH7_9BACT|nr:hypothetical protein Pla52o_18180 [Novipirellula galeiformis]